MILRLNTLAPVGALVAALAISATGYAWALDGQHCVGCGRGRDHGVGFGGGHGSGYGGGHGGFGHYGFGHGGFGGGRESFGGGHGFGSSYGAGSNIR